jgi:hypothetical protein
MKILAFFLGLPRWGRRLLVAGTSVLLVYAALGFLVLPAVIKAKLPPLLSQTLGRQVVLKKVRSNPFALSVTLDGFQVLDRDGETFFGWDRLYVNLGIGTLFGRTLSLQDVMLVRPRGRLVIEKDGRLNISDILERLGKDAPGSKPKAEESPREFAVDHLAIQGARIQLLDRSLSEPFETTLGPVTLELNGFRTERGSRSPYAFSGRTESGESFSWTGDFSTEPLRSQGKLALERLVLAKYHPYYKDQVAFELRDGFASVRAGYAFEWSPGTHVLKLQDGTLDLVNLKLAETGQQENAVELPRLEVRGVQANLIDRSAEIDSAIAWDGKLDVKRLKGGELSLAKLLTPKPRPKPEEPERPFALHMKELGTRNFSVSFEDMATVRPVRMLAEKIDLTLRDFSLDPKASARLTANLVLDGRTKLQLEGPLYPFRPSVDLTFKLDGLELPPLDPYLYPALDVRVNRGQLSLAGRLRGSFEGKVSDAIAFKGNVRMERFEAMDGAQQEPFLRYKELRLTGLDLSTNPRTLGIQSVELVEPEHRMVIARDGTTNVARALKSPPEPPPSPAGAVLGAVVPATPPEAFKVAIAKVHMRGGRLAFIDRSLEPNAAFLITDLEGTNTGLSTEPTANASLDLKGKAGGLAPLSIQGRSMPLRRDQDTDVTLRIQGADLSDLSPYSGKYLGYTVRKGKLDVDARVKIDHRKLNAVVKTTMDQFYFGDRTESPEATRLPVKLALALLRDRKGVIDLELPVEGSLDDPEFRYGRIVWKALLNVLTKIVTSPFDLIGSLFGGEGADLSFAAFPPGESVPDAAARKKVEILIKALIERPELNLEIEGTSDPSADGMALQKLALEQLIRAAKIRSLQAKTPDLDPDSVQLLPEERPRWLLQAYETAFPSPKGVPEKSKTPPPPPGEMEQRLLGTLKVDPNQLRELADRRTKALAKLLLEGGRIEAGRVFEVEGGERAKLEGGSRVYFSLK